MTFIKSLNFLPRVIFYLFTYSVYSEDRFSEPPNSSVCAYDAGAPGCISINSGWGGKCYIHPMLLY